MTDAPLEYRMRHACFAAVALCLATPAVAQPPPAPPAQGAASGDTAATVEELPIRSTAQLATYLRAHAGQATPLDALTPGARERFLDGLVFGRDGLGGFDTQDLPQLTREQGRALLALFGAERYAERLPHWATQPRAYDPAAPIGDLERRYNVYNRNLDGLRRTGRDPWPAVRSALSEAFDPAALAHSDATALDLLYRAVVATYALRPTPAGLDTQLQVLAQLRRRGQASAAQVDDAGNALLLAHRVEDARRLVADGGSADWPHWLRFEDRLGAQAQGPTLWSLDADGRTLRRQRIDLRPTQLLVTAGCHFAADAARAIAADPELGPAFRRHALWLTLPPGSENLEALRAWNQAQPQTPLHPLYDVEEWPLLPREWRMPTFFLVRDGKVLAQLQGWPADDIAQRSALKAMLQGAGLL
ncbi:MULTISPECIES: hypothetical protein [Xanthomonas]|uniref:hypothetical protein n=1 Tax=Xanthomonas TaxID=338 RepID=UPI001FD1D175|nr:MULTISPECIES: hypothetical protein [unclassified Xanthomonas]WNH43206.1 hypothetical protein PG878_11675 [Xanthomonas sp. A6251]